MLKTPQISRAPESEVLYVTILAVSDLLTVSHSSPTHTDSLSACEVVGPCGVACSDLLPSPKEPCGIRPAGPRAL